MEGCIPMKTEFEVKVNLFVTNAHFTTVGPLLCDSQLHIYGVSPMSKVRQQLASTSKKLFTSFPEWNEMVRLTVPSSFSTVLVEAVDPTTGTFLGAARVPLSTAVCGKEQDRRLMLVPRACALDNLAGTKCEGDEEFVQQSKQLETHQVDDFGFVTVSWEVLLVPNGGVCKLEEFPKETLSFPLGCTVRAQWLTSAMNGTTGVVFVTLVEFTSGGERFTVDGRLLDVVLPDGSAKTATFTMMRKSLTDALPKEVGYVFLSLPFDSPHDREVSYCCPVQGAQSEADWGVLMVSVRLHSIPGGGPAALVPRTADVGRQAPDCSPTLDGAVFWESDEHIARATERRWRRSCVVECKATESHLRHLFDVHMKRATLDAGMNGLISAFFTNGDTASSDLRELLVGLAFAAGFPFVSIPLACRFCFAVMRREAEKAITIDDVTFILEHCLVPKSLDLPRGEIKRRIQSIFVHAPNGIGAVYVTYDQFMHHFARNYSLWYNLGIQLEGNTSGPATIASGNRPATVNSLHGTTGTETAVTDEERWRQFHVRVLKTGRAFAVTAHVEDTIEKVKRLIEESVAIPAHIQRFIFDGKPLENGQLVGVALPPQLIAANYEISVTQAEEQISVVMVYRAQHKKWEVSVNATEKVLKLRGMAQQKTMIPLTRLLMSYAGQQLWDRHTLDHYKIGDGSIIELTAER